MNQTTVMPPLGKSDISAALVTLARSSATRHSITRMLFACVLLQFASAGFGQAAQNEWETYEKRLEKAQTVEMLGSELFGDKVDLQTGGLSFSVTDVDLPGNNALPVRFTRTYRVVNTRQDRRLHALADWAIEIPRIYGTFVQVSGPFSNPAQWTVGNTYSNNRCSIIDAPRQPSDVPGSIPYLTESFWQGNMLDIPGVVSGELLATASGVQKPDASYLWTVDGQTHLKCLPNLQGGTGAGLGEGFEAITPDGTKYKFNRMATRDLVNLQLTNPDTAGTNAFHISNLAEISLYVTEIIDRFGNRVEYTYANAWNEPVKLTDIRGYSSTNPTTPDRHLQIDYNGGLRVWQVRTVPPATAPPTLARIWTYAYVNDASGAPTLSSVLLPDNRSWVIGFSSFSDSPIVPAEKGNTCYLPAAPDNILDEKIGTITHPSGAVGTFKVALELHGRSNVSLNCKNVVIPQGSSQNDPEDDANRYSVSAYSWSLMNKTISSPTMTSQNWSYSYYSEISTFFVGVPSQMPACTLGAVCETPVCLDDQCAGRSRTTVIRPDGEAETHVFGNSWQYDEGKLLYVVHGNLFAESRDEDRYAYYLGNGVGQNFPVKYGTSLRSDREGFSSERHRPMVFRETQRGARYLQVVAFRWSVLTQGLTLAMDALARPLTVKKESFPGEIKFQKYEFTSLPSIWVLGLPTRTLTGFEENKTVESARAEYYPATGNMHRFYAHGMLKQTLAYHPDGSLQAITDGLNQTSQANDWFLGVPREFRFPDGSTQSAEVDGNGWIKSRTDSLGQRWEFYYDAIGDITEIRPPNDPGADPWAITTFSFQQLQSNPPYGLPAGVWRQRMTRGAYQQDTYVDALYRPVLVHETGLTGPSANRFQVKRFDTMNREQFTAYPVPSLSNLANITLGTRRQFDERGRVRVEEVDAGELAAPAINTTLFSYPANRTEITNPRGKITKIHYQSFDEPTEEFPELIEASHGQITVINRDVYGKPLTISRTSGSTTVQRQYVYDSGQRLCKRIEPETGAHVFDYDAADNLLWSAHGMALPDNKCERSLADVPSNQRIQRAYDLRNRLTGISYPGGATAPINYTYRLDGTLRTASRGGSTWTYDYNSLGALRSETLEFENAVRSFAYDYNPSGFLRTTVYPRTPAAPGGEIIGHAPNGLGQPTSVGSYLTTASYYANGALNAASFGNGVQHTRLLNVRQLPRELKYATSSQVLLELRYLFDANDNVQTISDVTPTPNSTQNQSFVYDDLDRLIGATAPQSYGSAVFEYDVFDNLRRHQVGARDWRYRYTDGSNRLNTIETAASQTIAQYSYDFRGNTTSGILGQGPTATTINTNFDRAETVTSIVENGVTTEFTYDAHGHRIKIVTGGVTRYPVYTRDGLLRHEFGDGEIFSYYYLGTQLIARNKDFAFVDRIFRSGFEALGSLVEKLQQMVGAKTISTEYYLSDHLGSNVATVDTAGGVIERSQFEPYGERLGTRERGPGFTGHFDDANGLAYMKARYYGGAVGRFISPDPVGTNTASGANFNRYWYADANPLKYVDPDGRQTRSEEHFANLSEYVGFEMNRQQYKNSTDPVERVRLANWLANEYQYKYGDSKSANKLREEASAWSRPITTMDPLKITAIQKGASEAFTDVDHTRGETITSMKEQLLNDSGYNKKVTPIRIFEQDGVVYTLDHRRLQAHIEAGVPIQTVNATAGEIGNAMRTKNDYDRLPPTGTRIKVRGRK